VTNTTALARRPARSSVPSGSGVVAVLNELADHLLQSCFRVLLCKTREHIAHLQVAPFVLTLAAAPSHSGALSCYP
jgi:hypothetical protein